MTTTRALFHGLLLIAVVLLFCAITSPARADHSFDIDPNPSPEASTSLICPNDNLSDCYPTLFQPTIHFQKIRPQQSLPPGLHVRINIQTGEKEARLNVPDESERNMNEAIVIIDDVSQTKETSLGVVEEEDSHVQLRLQDAPKQAKHARPYSPPRYTAPVNADEASLYEEALSTLRQNPLVSKVNDPVHDTPVAHALQVLTELAHSMEWGLTICRDADLVLPLLKAIFSMDDQINPESQSAILLLLATAIQNNSDALSALIRCYDAAEGGSALLRRTMASLEADLLMLSEGGSYPKIVARKIFFLSQLCMSKNILQTFLVDGGGKPGTAFPLLLGTFSTTNVNNVEARIKIKHRVANFVADHAENYAAFHVASKMEIDEVAAEQLRNSLQPWCSALWSGIRDYGEDDSLGFLEARREVSRVLELYTGEGCIVELEYEGRKEL